MGGLLPTSAPPRPVCRRAAPARRPQTAVPGTRASAASAIRAAEAIPTAAPARSSASSATSTPGRAAARASTATRVAASAFDARPGWRRGPSPGRSTDQVIATCRRGPVLALRSPRAFRATAQAALQTPRYVRSARAHLRGRDGHRLARPARRARRAPRRAEGDPARARAQQGVHRDVPRRGGDRFAARASEHRRDPRARPRWSATLPRDGGASRPQPPRAAERRAGARRSLPSRGRSVDRRADRRRPPSRPRDGRRARTDPEYRPPGRQPLQHLHHPAGRPQAHRFRPREGARSPRFDGDRGRQRQAGLPGSRASPGARGRSPRRRVCAGRDPLGSHAGQASIPRRQRRGDHPARARGQRARSDDGRRGLSAGPRRCHRSRSGARSRGAMADRGRAARGARRLRARRRRCDRCAAGQRARDRTVGYAHDGRVGGSRRRCGGGARAHPRLGRRAPEAHLDARIGRGDRVELGKRSRGRARAGNGHREGTARSGPGRTTVRSGGQGRRCRHRARAPRARHRRRAIGRRFDRSAARGRLPASFAQRVHARDPASTPPWRRPGNDGPPRRRARRVQRDVPQGRPARRARTASRRIGSEGRCRPGRVGAGPRREPSARGRAEGPRGVAVRRPEGPRVARLTPSSDGRRLHRRSAAGCLASRRTRPRARSRPASGRCREGRAAARSRARSGDGAGSRCMRGPCGCPRRCGVARGAAPPGGRARDPWTASRSARGRRRLHRPRSPGRPGPRRVLVPERDRPASIVGLDAAVRARGPRLFARDCRPSARRLARPARPPRRHAGATPPRPSAPCHRRPRGVARESRLRDRGGPDGARPVTVRFDSGRGAGPVAGGVVVAGPAHRPVDPPRCSHGIASRARPATGSRGTARGVAGRCGSRHGAPADGSGRPSRRR